MTTASTTRTLPAPVQGARLALYAVALSHLVIPIVMWFNRDTLASQITAEHPEFDHATVDVANTAALAAAAGFHGVLLVLTVFLALKLRSGRRWVRRLTTVSQLLSVVFSVVSWTSSPMFHAVIPVVGVLQIGAVVLLWWPARAKEFFAVQ